MNKRVALFISIIFSPTVGVWGQSTTETQLPSQQTTTIAAQAPAQPPAPTQEPPKPKEETHPVELPPVPAYLIRYGQIGAKFDKFNPRGWNIPFPSTGDTVMQDIGGVRSALAAHNFGFLMWNQMIYQNNELSGARNPQVYAGQKPTFVGFELMSLTYNIPSQHLQFVVMGQDYNITWKPLGPTTFRLANLTVNQTLLNGKLWWEGGYVANDTAYYGGYTGGNVAGGTLGLSSIIYYEIGQNYHPWAVPGVNLKANFTKTFYTRFGVQRTIPAGGEAAENKDNASGFRFMAKDSSKALLILEPGYRQDAAPGKKEAWYRVTGWYNRQKYPDYRTPNAAGLTDNNWAFSLAADKQIAQPNKFLPFDGIYIGGTVQYAPPQQNLYTQYYEARAYAFGLIPKRPLDMVTLLASRTNFSAIAENYLQSIPKAYTGGNSQLGVTTYDNSDQVSGSYMVHLMHGFDFNANLAYQQRPTYAPRLKAAFLTNCSVTLFF